MKVKSPSFYFWIVQTSFSIWFRDFRITIQIKFSCIQIIVQEDSLIFLDVFCCNESGRRLILTRPVCKGKRVFNFVWVLFVNLAIPDSEITFHQVSWSIPCTARGQGDPSKNVRIFEVVSGLRAHQVSTP